MVQAVGAGGGWAAIEAVPVGSPLPSIVTTVAGPPGRRAPAVTGTATRTTAVAVPAESNPVNRRIRRRRRPTVIAWLMSTVDVRGSGPSRRCSTTVAYSSSVSMSPPQAGQRPVAEQPAQRGEPVRGLALHGAFRTVQQRGHLGHRQVVQEPQDEHGPLPRRHLV